MVFCDILLKCFVADYCLCHILPILFFPLPSLLTHVPQNHLRPFDSVHMYQRNIFPPAFPPSYPRWPAVFPDRSYSLPVFSPVGNTARKYTRRYAHLFCLQCLVISGRNCPMRICAAKKSERTFDVPLSYMNNDSQSIKLCSLSNKKQVAFFIHLQ